MYKIKILIILVFCGVFSIGCSSEKPSDNNNSTSDEVQTSDKESEGKPTANEIRKGIDWFFSTDIGKDKRIGSPNSCTTIGGHEEKKIDEVSVVKMTDKKKGDPKQMSLGEGQRDYWAAEVKIMGRCIKDFEVNQPGPLREFQTEGRYNIYQSDFDEWRAWPRDQ